jgi:hypothetical protein
LFYQGRDKVKGLVDPGVVFKDFDHIQIILYPVQAHPGKMYFATYQVPVIGLVHMPDKGKIEHYKIIIKIEVKVKATKNPGDCSPGVFCVKLAFRR